MKCSKVFLLFLITLVVLLELMEGYRWPSWPNRNPRRLRKVSSQLKVFYKGDAGRRPPYQRAEVRCWPSSRQQRPTRKRRRRSRKCQRRYPRQQYRARSDYLEAPRAPPPAAAVTEYIQIETNNVSTEDPALSWTRDISSHFAQMADSFAQSLQGSNIEAGVGDSSSYRVQYNSNSVCPKPADEPPPICRRRRGNGSAAATHECWSAGHNDGCKDSEVCCFNGCENVCYNPPQKKDTCPSLDPATASSLDCRNSRPNCWSADTFDLDCPDSGADLGHIFAIRMNILRSQGFYARSFCVQKIT